MPSTDSGDRLSSSPYAQCRVKLPQQSYRKQGHHQLNRAELVGCNPHTITTMSCAAVDIPDATVSAKFVLTASTCNLPNVPLHVLCHLCFDSVHLADIEHARLHRRIQSAEHIARLAESKVSADMTSVNLIELQICACLSLGVSTPILHRYKGTLLCWQAGENSPRVPKLGSGLKLALDDEDVCPTCLEPYLEGTLLSQSSCP